MQFPGDRCRFHVSQDCLLTRSFCHRSGPRCRHKNNKKNKKQISPFFLLGGSEGSPAGVSCTSAFCFIIGPLTETNFSSNKYQPRVRKRKRKTERGPRRRRTKKNEGNASRDKGRRSLGLCVAECVKDVFTSWLRVCVCVCVCVCV